MKITLDENGNIVDRLAERNDEIIRELAPKLQLFIDKEQGDTSKGKHKYGFQLQMQIVDALHKYPRMPPEVFAELTADDIWDYYEKYHSLLAYYNMHFEIVPNVELFTAFMGINMRMYLELKNGGYNEDEAIIATINCLETEVLGNSYGAADHGNADFKSISKRVSAKGVHEVISASEDKIIKVAENSSPAQLSQWLSSVIGGGDEKKKLKGGKSSE